MYVIGELKIIFISKLKKQNKEKQIIIETTFIGIFCEHFFEESLKIMCWGFYIDVSKSIAYNVTVIYNNMF